MLLAPAIELGKEVLYLSSYRSDPHGTAQLADQLTWAERQEAHTTMLRQMAAFGTLIFFLWGPYCVLTESSALQGTLGKRMLGLRVTDLNGRRIRLGRAVLRFLARMISATPWHFGFVMAGFTSKKRALHDLLVGTLVVIADKTEETEDYARKAPVCATCSAELLGDAAFCTWCGAAIPFRPRVRYAGFGRRALAVFLDLVILTPVILILLSCVAPVSREEMQAMRDAAGDRLGNSEREEVQLVAMTRFAWLCMLILCVGGPYSVLTESSALQGTLGKRAMGLKVTDLDGRRIRPGRAIGRYLAHILSTVLWLAGFVMVVFTPRRQALHDILAGTLVVVAGKTESQAYPRRASA
jgi:uncharacterized RDD family membrane protein YckC